MSDISIYSIDVTPKGLDKLSQVPAIISKASESVSKVKPPLDPLDKIVKVLTEIEKILMSIGRVGVESFNKLDGILATNQKGLAKMHDGASKLEKQIGNIGETSKKSGKDVEEGLLAKFNKIGMAIQSVKNIASVATGVLTPIFEEGMARQNAVSDFETLLYGDRAGAESLAKELRDLDAAKLYGTSAINENVKMMLAYGVDTETSFQMTEALGDIAMGSKDKMNSLAMAFSQMSGLGVLQTQDWKQMVGAGFNPFDQMEKELGKTKDELSTMMSKGQITSDMVKDAFIHATALSYKDKEGKTQYTFDEEEAKKNSADGTYEKGQFYGSAAGTLENTLGGRIAGMKSGFDDLKAKLFELALPIAEKLLPLITDKLLPIIEKMLPLVEKFMPVLDGVIWVLSQLADYIAENIDVISELAVGIGVIVGAFMLLTSPVTWIIVAIGALTAGLVWLVNNWEEWHDTVVKVCFPLAVLIDMIKSVKKHWDNIVDGFSSGGILEGIKRIGYALLDGILRPMQTLLEWTAKVTGWQWVKNLGAAVDEYRKGLDAKLPEPAKSPEPYQSPDTDPAADPMKAEALRLGFGNTAQDAREKAANSKTPDTSAALAKATGKGKNEVSSGGTRNTQITINLGNMVETVNFNGTPQDNAQATVDTFTTQLLRALYSVQTAV